MAENAHYYCYVGNLAWSTTDEGLKQAFEKFGPLLDATVFVHVDSGRSRGYGFVCFKERADMEKAIKEMDGKELDGGLIIVRPRHDEYNHGGGRIDDRYIPVRDEIEEMITPDFAVDRYIHARNEMGEMHRPYHDEGELDGRAISDDKKHGHDCNTRNF